MMNNNANPKREGDQLTVAIKEEQITVAPESRATVHVGILNDGPNEDYLDILVRGVPPEWVTVHTPVVHVAAGEAKLVTLTVQPPMLPEGRVGQYPMDVRVVSQSDPKRWGVARSILTVAAYQSRGRVGLVLASIQFAAVPGSMINIPVLLQNRGDEEDTFRLSVTGLPENWVTTNSMLTILQPNTSAEVQLTLQIPRTAEAIAGRRPFIIQCASQLFPTQTTEVECILTISTFSQYSASLEPGLLQAGQFGQVVIQNEGNTTDTYSLSFQSPDGQLLFEKTAQVPAPGSPAGRPHVATAYVEIPAVERFQLRAGERGVYSFRTRLRSRPILGNELTYPFKVNVRSTADEAAELAGQLSERGLLPFWMLPAGVGALLVLCLLLAIPLWRIPTSARATQTASFNQTQAALAAQGDSDGDGLTNDREAALGTDPLQPDSDGDRLPDREEVEARLTNPLDTDTDDDRVQDGDEVLTSQTDPRNPDMDGDGRLDGDEIAGGSDPRNPDTDGDGLRDGDEIKLQSDPRNPDSDGDGLQDGRESATCPLARDPDSDDDGIVDGRDLDPCNATNPALTATAAAAAAQATAAAPTIAPTNTPIPTSTVAPTSPPAATQPPALPSLQGIMLLGSDRDGNPEVYASNLGNQALVRLTNNPAQDVQPALAPDAIQIVYVSNQTGNNEIYLAGLDGRATVNLTNNAGDDQHPTWSPDGNWIAFTSNRNGNQEIYIMRRDGTEVRNLTNNSANDFAATWYSVGGLLGPQDWIAFTTTRDGNQEVYKIKPDGSSLTNLTQNPANDHSPAGSTGGALLAFVTDRDGNSEIYTMTDAGGATNNITRSPAQDLDPAMNPAGNWIAFSSDRDGNLEVYVVATTGGASYNLTRHPGQDRYPDW